MLRDGAPFAVSFPTKTVAVWRALDPAAHTARVALYLERARFRDAPVEMLGDGQRGAPLTIGVGRA